MTTTKPDLVLRPTKKTRTSKRAPQITMPSWDGRRPVVADVLHLGGTHGAYQHPVLAIGLADKDGEISYTGHRINVMFQRNASAKANDYDQLMRGFLGDGYAGHCYAGSVELRLDNLDTATKLQAIVARASEAGRKAGLSTGCQLMRLIVGLRKIGVEVRIYNKAIADRRIKHDSRCAADAFCGNCARRLDDEGECRGGCSQREVA